MSTSVFKLVQAPLARSSPCVSSPSSICEERIYSQDLFRRASKTNPMAVLTAGGRAWRRIAILTVGLVLVDRGLVALEPAVSGGPDLLLRRDRPFQVRVDRQRGGCEAYRTGSGWRFPVFSRTLAGQRRLRVAVGMVFEPGQVGGQPLDRRRRTVGIVQEDDRVSPSGHELRHVPRHGRPEARQGQARVLRGGPVEPARPAGVSSLPVQVRPTTTNSPRTTCSAR